MRPIVFAFGLLLAACGASDPLPAPEGVAPLASAPTVAHAPATVVLEAPPERPAEPAVAAPAPADVPAAMLVFEVEPLGRFEVITWAEAERRAAERIGPDSFQSELARLRTDVFGRRR